MVREAASSHPQAATWQYTGAPQAFHRYNARLDRDSLTKKYYVPAQTSPGIAQPRP
ncbi:hypothetical protein EMIT0P218_210004 [Pseudomonas sp. IT-P218]